MCYKLVISGPWKASERMKQMGAQGSAAAESPEKAEPWAPPGPVKSLSAGPSQPPPPGAFMQAQPQPTASGAMEKVCRES